MHRMMLFLWLLGAAIYAGFSLVPPPEQPLKVGGLSQLDKELGSHDRLGDPAERKPARELSARPADRPGAAPRTQPPEIAAVQPKAPAEDLSSGPPDELPPEPETAGDAPPSEAPDEPPKPPETAEEDPPSIPPGEPAEQPETAGENLPSAASGQPAKPDGQVPGDNAGGGEPDRAYGIVARPAPVHSEPSAEADVLGYTGPGAPVEVVERKDGYVKVINPDSGKEGWISEANVMGAPPPHDSDRQWGAEPSEEAAIAPSDEEMFPEAPQQRAATAKKGKKKFGRRGKRLKFGLRFRRR